MTKVKEVNEAFEKTAKNVRSQFESLDAVTEDDFDVDAFIADVREEMNEARVFSSEV